MKSVDSRSHGNRDLYGGKCVTCNSLKQDEAHIINSSEFTSDVVFYCCVVTRNIFHFESKERALLRGTADLKNQEVTWV